MNERAPLDQPSSPTYWQSWLDGIAIYISLVLASIVFWIANTLIVAIARGLGSPALQTIAMLGFVVVIGPIILSKIFRALDGSKALPCRPDRRREEAPSTLSNNSDT